MKKIFTILALMIATVALGANDKPLNEPAKASNTYSFSGTALMRGDLSATGKGENSPVDIKITDKGNGYYDLVLSGMSLPYFYLGTITFSNIPGVIHDNYITLSSDGKYISASVENSTCNYGETSMTIDCSFTEEYIYLYLSGRFQGWSDNPFTILIDTYPKYEFNNITHYSNGDEYGTINVIITDRLGGFYDIEVGDNIKFKSVPGTVDGDSVVFSTDSIYGKDSFFKDKYKMVVRGKMKGDQLELYFGGKDLSTGKRFSFAVGKNLDEAGHYIYTCHFYDKALTWKWEGLENGTGTNETNVDIVDIENGLFNIKIKKLTMESDDAEITFSNVPGKVKGDGIIFSTNGESIDATITSKLGNSAKMTVDGRLLGKDLYLFCRGKYMNWSDLPFTITVGSEFMFYIDNATTSTSESNKQTFENSQVEVYVNDDNVYKFIVKNFQLDSYEIGDLTVEGVTGVTNEDGSISYSFNGKAKVSNLGDGAAILNITKDSELDFNFEAKSKDEKLYVNGTINLSFFPCSYVFGSDDFGGTDVTNGISVINADDLNGKADIYTINGVKVNALQKGINIVRMKGKTVKVVKR